MVESLAGYGIPTAKIANVLNISQNTLLKHYGDEIRCGSAVVEAKLVDNLFKIASGKDSVALKALMFSLQCRFGWSQYAPAPAQPKEKLGKKEIAQIEAETAHEATEWGNLLQ